jgi:tetraacyldisaccharide-1-P 4'-kinase
MSSGTKSQSEQASLSATIVVFPLVMATGTGKTRTCIALVDGLMRAGHVQRVLLLVNRIAFARTSARRI